MRPSEKAKVMEKLTYAQQKAFKSKLQDLNPIVDLNPQTLRQYSTFSKRLYFERREATAKKPLIILVFDGMMGKFKKSPQNESMLYIRKGLSKGMKLLSSAY